MLRIKLFNLPKVINQSQNIVIKNAYVHNRLPISLFEYNKYTFVKYNASYNDNKIFLIQNVIALESFRTEEQKEMYLISQKFNSFVRYYHNLIQHPKVLKIEKEEGADYIVNIIRILQII